MKNELLLAISLFGCYGLVILWYYLCGVRALSAWVVFATIAANIEVMILVDAFGMSQTLGNAMFASTFLAVDIVSETSGKRHARRAVNISILASASFILVSQLWLLFTPSPEDFIFPHMQAVFSQTPRIMIAGLVVFAIIQHFDVWAYHKWWEFTERKFGSKKRFLWLRNNFSTFASQGINSVLFSIAAFAGVYDTKTIISIIITSYAIFFIAALADTPFIYLARFIQSKRYQGE